jgi:hypothetical protein
VANGQCHSASQPKEDRKTCKNQSCSKAEKEQKVNHTLDIYVSSFWVWAGMTFGALLIGELAFKLINRLLRTIKVLARGWPTMPLMDADGDIVHPKQPAAEEPRYTRSDVVHVRGSGGEK